MASKVNRIDLIPIEWAKNDRLDHLEDTVEAIGDDVDIECEILPHKVRIDV